MPKKVLFILKRRLDYNPDTHSPKSLSTGLFNSANFMNDMLNDMGIESVIEVATDNNCIDRLVTKHKPTHVIIEALWVIPSKFSILTTLHPNVTWIVRLHSEIPFIASEGMAFDWLGDYVTYKQVVIGVNAPRMLEEARTYLSIKQGWTEDECYERIVYMPNFYPQNYERKRHDFDKPYIDVACFGAVRPLKNHLLQAVAALKFADKINKKLRFHINLGRIEGKGDPILHNLHGMFQQLVDTDHQLIGHHWAQHDDFIKICASMDIGLQCNFSETFNIVSADLISQGVPIIGSEEIPWSSNWFNAKPAFSDDIYKKLLRTYHYPKFNVLLNQHKLTKYTNETKKIWWAYFKDSK